MKLPAVRFVRCFDPQELRMVNLWLSITTQEQLDNAPMATELTVTAPTIEEALFEIRKWNPRWLTQETVREIENASRKLIPAQPSIYEARNA